MASYGKQRILGRVIVMILLIAALAVGGIFWFDYLGLVDAKNFFAPALRLVGVKTVTGESMPASAPSLLEDERFAKQVAAIDSMRQELEEREKATNEKEAGIVAMVQEIEDRSKDLEEKENSFKQLSERYENRNTNIEQNARYLTGMPPANAVKILLASDDQTVIDVLRKVEEIAAASGTNSVVAYWLSLMPSDRAATIQRKMSEKPASTN